MSDSDHKHRGRIQAQGNQLEKSESWSQDKPPTVDEGLNFLQRLIAKLTKPQLSERKKEFEKAEKFIKQAGESGGVDAQVSKTFKKKGSKDIRVDIEVIKGTAFVKKRKK